MATVVALIPLVSYTAVYLNLFFVEQDLIEWLRSMILRAYWKMVAILWSTWSVFYGVFIPKNKSQAREFLDYSGVPFSRPSGSTCHNRDETSR